MPPRTRRAITPLASERSSPSPAPALQPQAPSTSHDNSDPGDVTDASDSDDSEPAQDGYSLYVNNPDVIPILPKSRTPEIDFFYDKTLENVICRVCR